MTNSNSSSTVVLITGCSSGIGKQLAITLSQRPGFKVFASARNPDSLAPLKPLGIFAVKLDVTDEKSVKAAVDSVISSAGKIDIVVNNAGMSVVAPAAEVSMDQARKQFNTNFFGCVSVINHVFPHMVRTGSGKIVNIGSVAGFVAIPLLSFYCASKAALEIYTDSLRIEAEPFGAPGTVESEISGKGTIAVSETGAYSSAKGIIGSLFENSKTLPKTKCEEFCRGLANQICKSKMPTQYVAAYGSWIVWALSFFPKWFKGFVMSNALGFTKVASALRASRHVKSE